MSHVLILGGTGFVGRSLCTLLAERGFDVTVPTRDKSAALKLGLPASVDLVSADVHDLAELTRLVAGKDAVVNLVAILHGSEAQFDRTHVELPRTLVSACRAARVRRIVHVSALGVDSPRPSRYLRSKAQGEKVFKDADIDATVLRPSVIYGEKDRFLNLFARLMTFAPVFPLACAGARFQPVWVEDVARAILVCLERPETSGQTFECAGPDIYTLAELVKLVGRWSGHERPVLPLPQLVGTLQALVMELLPGKPLMSRDNLESMRTPNVATGLLPILGDLGISPAALSVIGPRYLGDDGAPSKRN